MEDVGEIAPLADKIDAILADLDRKKNGVHHSRYWLAIEMGVSHGTLWNLLNRSTGGIQYKTLARLCKALRCQPGDLLEYIPPRR